MQEILSFLSSHLLLSSAAIILFIFIVGLEIFKNKRGHFSISPQEAINRINHQQAVVIDTRNPDAYRSGHIVNALAMKPDDIKPGSTKLAKFKSKPLIIVCYKGIGSQKIAENLTKNGYNATSLAGGMEAWKEAQLPVIKES